MSKRIRTSKWKNALTLMGVGLFATVALAGGTSLIKASKKRPVIVLPAPSPTPSPTPTPTPTPTSTPTLTSGGSLDLSAVQLPSIASNFDVNSLLVPSWGTGELAKSGFPDTVGAFRFICGAGQLASDDPIVHPGQPGASHLHQFFGNTGANAFSTYASLRTSGDSTCNNMLNRSAYWMPAMLNGKGGVVRPDYVVVYYKRFPKNSAYCTTKGKACVDLPRGLRFVFGYNMIDPSKTPTGASFFDCQGSAATPGRYPTITEARAGCPVGTQLGAKISAPECWNGIDLDSPDHRSHVAYQMIDPNDGQAKCPATHPYIIPTFSLGVWYTTDADMGTWRLSSDDMPGMPSMPSGSTFHADWFGAWDDNVMATWGANCIEKLLSCAGGDLGNGWQLRMDHGYSYVANPRVVPVPT